MKNHKPFEKDEVTRKLLNKAGLEEPSWNFTSLVMDKINAGLSPGVFVYRPVISKKGWWVISVLSVLIVFLVLVVPDSGHTRPDLLLRYFSTLKVLTDQSFPEFFKNISPDFTIPGLAGIISACWLLFAADKWLGRKALHN